MLHKIQPTTSCLPITTLMNIFLNVMKNVKVRSQVKLRILQHFVWISLIHLQTTLCYYDIKDALQLDPDHAEGRGMMERMEKRAQDSKYTAMQLNLMGKHREALQKISIAIETNPAVADFHVLRYETLCLLNIVPRFESGGTLNLIRPSVCLSVRLSVTKTLTLAITFALL